ncbi:MAG TPA: hypothetical protein VG942_16140 [Hyphomonadaceae bacterium]|nr:hypothetical protein [Hyphomonadaceae bacterium]
MNSSTSSSESPTPDASAGKTSAGLFLASMAGAMVLAATAVSLSPESWIHGGPEYGMAEAFEDHIEQACSAKEAPDLLIIGDSRAVAGISAQTVRATGLNAEKFALGGAGIFQGWAVLDRLLDCGVRPKSVVMAYGTINMLESGAVMERTVNYDIIKGPRAGYEYGKAAEWEDRKARQLGYKAISIFGAEGSGIDFVLMMPALRAVLAQFPEALLHHQAAERERVDFLANQGDRYYGQADSASALPDEAQFTDNAPDPMAIRAARAVADLGRTNGFPVYFYVLPVNETARTGLRPAIFDMVRAFEGELKDAGVVMLNQAWALPDADFGDPSHVNARGRPIVTADFLARYNGALSGETAVKAGQPGRPAQANDAVSPAVQEVEEGGK